MNIVGAGSPRPNDNINNHNIIGRGYRAPTIFVFIYRFKTTNQ